jgi:UDP-glucose 4-epimerase
VLSGKMVLRSSGLQQRDFIAIAEVCRVSEYLSTRAFDAMLPRVFNMGSGVSKSVLEIAQFIQQRCKRVLGFEPELLRPEAGADEKHEMLEFRLDGLSKMGINVGLDNNMEIDKLLAFCHASYSQSRSEGV